MSDVERITKLEGRVTSLEIAMAKVDVKLNVITFLGASSVVATFSLIVAILANHL